MWELNYKETWVPKNWCFWTVVLEKTLESPLDCKEIQPVYPKGDQSWVFIGRTDVEAETLILWPPDAKNWLTGSTKAKTWPYTFWFFFMCFACVAQVRILLGINWSLLSSVQFSSFQSLSHVQLFATPWTTAHQASLPITNSRSLLKIMSIMSVMPSNHLILCHALLLQPSILPSTRVFSNESVLCIMWPKYWSFSFSISPSKECSRLISFWIDWLDLLAVQETLKSFQYYSSKAAIFQRSAFFTVQPSQLYMTTGKNIA